MIGAVKAVILAGGLGTRISEETYLKPKPMIEDAVQAKRSKRLNVIGALLSSCRLLMTQLWHSVNGLWFFGFLMGLSERVSKPLVMILDNASIHTAKSMQPYRGLLEEKGLRFYFLPPYSPELNRI